MVSRLAPFQHAFVDRLSELGIAYAGSPIVEGDGRRYFDDSIRGGGGIGSRFLLVLGKDAPPAARGAAAALCSELSDVAELRDGTGDGLTLVRPDGYVASTRQGAEPAWDLESLRSLIECQVNPS
jgi:hypothetical protein